MAEQEFHPLQNLPGCMMPDGGDCCAGYTALADDWHKLRNSHADLVKALEAAEAAYQALIGRAGYRVYQALEDTATKLRQEALAPLIARKAV